MSGAQDQPTTNSRRPSSLARPWPCRRDGDRPTTVEVFIQRHGWSTMPYGTRRPATRRGANLARRQARRVRRRLEPGHRIVSGSASRSSTRSPARGPDRDAVHRFGTVRRDLRLTASPLRGLHHAPARREAPPVRAQLRTGGTRWSRSSSRRARSPSRSVSGMSAGPVSRSAGSRHSTSARSCRRSSPGSRRPDRSARRGGSAEEVQLDRRRGSRWPCPPIARAGRAAGG